MILKIKKSCGFVYIDNIYRIDVEQIKKADYRRSEKGNTAIWMEDLQYESPSDAIPTPNEFGFYITVQHYMYEHECRTVKITTYIIDSGYLLNDNGKTIESLHT